MHVRSVPIPHTTIYPWLSHKRAWTLELLTVHSNALAPALHPVLAHIWQRSGNPKGAWLFLPPYPHFISRQVSSVSCLCSFRSLPCLRKVWDALPSDFFCFCSQSFWIFLDVLERSNDLWSSQSLSTNDISRRFSHFHTVCVSVNANPKIKIYYKLLARRGIPRTAVTLQK